MAVARYLGILFSCGANSRWESEGREEPHTACGVGGVMRIDDVVGSVRRCIRAMEGYVPGKQLSSGTYIKLNTNENPYPPSPRVLEAVRQTLTGDRLRKYPDPTGTSFRRAAAE